MSNARGIPTQRHVRAMTEVLVGMVNLSEVDFHPHNVRASLGDLRPLSRSIHTYGLLQPIVVERRGQRLRLRAGHRRVAAARLASINRLPAIIHPEPLDDRDWLAQAVQENVHRSALDKAERRRAILALRALGCSWDGVGEVFGVSGATARVWATGATTDTESASLPKAQGTPHTRAVRRLIAAHQAEYERLKLEEQACQPSPRKERRDAVAIDDVEHLLDCGESAHQITRRLGYKSERDLARVLHRAGRSDLAVRFDRVRAA